MAAPDPAGVQEPPLPHIIPLNQHKPPLADGPTDPGLEVFVAFPDPDYKINRGKYAAVDGKSYKLLNAAEKNRGYVHVVRPAPGANAIGKKKQPAGPPCRMFTEAYVQQELLRNPLPFVNFADKRFPATVSYVTKQLNEHMGHSNLTLAEISHLVREFAACYILDDLFRLMKLELANMLVLEPSLFVPRISGDNRSAPAWGVVHRVGSSLLLGL